MSFLYSVGTHIWSWWRSSTDDERIGWTLFAGVLIALIILGRAEGRFP